MRRLREGEDVTGITDNDGLLRCAAGHDMGPRKTFGSGSLVLRCGACKAVVYFEAEYGLFAGWSERRQREQERRTAGLSRAADWPGQRP